MKKFFALFVCIFLVSFSIAAETSSGMVPFYLTIEEDFGIVFPDDVLRLDRFVFEVQLKDGTSKLVPNAALNISELAIEKNSLDLNLCYYGNLSYRYAVRVKADIGPGWVGGDDMAIPIVLTFGPSAEAPYDVFPVFVQDNEIEVSIPPTGAKRNVPVAALNLDWSGIRDAIPGIYRAELWLELQTL